MSRRLESRTGTGYGRRASLLLALAACSACAGLPGSGESSSDGAVPQEWRDGAVRRIRDVFYLSEPPTFVDAGRPDPVAVVEAAVLLDLAGRLDAGDWSLTALRSLTDLDPTEQLVLADEFLDLPGELTDGDVALVASLLADTENTDPYIGAVHDRLSVATGRQLTDAAPCPSADTARADLYLAAALAQRVALRSQTCPPVEVAVDQGRTDLTAELVEDVRALRALVAVGAISDQVADEASGRLLTAVESALPVEPPSRSFLQLLHHAATADPAVAGTLANQSEPVIAAAERVLRWNGSLPDDVNGVDFDVTVQALRAVGVLDPEAAAVVAAQMIEAGSADAYDLVVDLAVDGRVDDPDVAAVSELPPSIAIPIVARFGTCQDSAEIAPSDLTSAGPTGDFGLDGVVASVTGRCSPSDDAGRLPTGDRRDQLLFRAARECAASGEPSREVADDAEGLIEDLDWTWAPSEATTVHEISALVTLLELGQGSCSGFWWAESDGA